MIRALYTAASGMTAQQMNLDTIANNLANSSTTGFRQLRLQFQDMIYQNLVTPGAAQSQSTPRGWNYEIRDGKRVPKSGDRVTKPDGSWREEVKQGNCVTVKERTASGEYKETRQCNPQS